MTKIPARPNSPNPPPKNLLLKIRKSSTPTPKLAPLARELLFAIFVYLFFLLVPLCLFCRYTDRADEGEEEPEVHGPAPTSTSNTLVLSEEHCVSSKASPPPQHDPKAPTPVAQPPSTEAEES
jgi:hypothetical protein